MQILGGGNACSEFRLKKLLSAAVQVKTLSARYVYFVDLPEESGKYLGESNYTRLCNLLEVFGDDQKALTASANHLIVVPRLGTISPWSTKATDISQHCGLTDIRRIERSILYRLQVPAQGLNSSEIDKISPLLHDRMIEAVFQNVSQLESIFTQSSPTELKNINMLEVGKSALEKANNELGLALAADEIEYLFENYFRY